MDITEQLINSIISDVAPEVASLTSWDLALGGMAVRVIPRDRAYEEICLKRLHDLGLLREHEEAHGVFERMGEYFMERLIGAAYDHWSAALLVVDDNMDDGNLDGLRIIIGHELVHRGQAVNHPELFAEVDQAVLDLVENRSAGFKESFGGIQAAMKLIEGHAALITAQLARRYPNARIETPGWLPGLILRLFGQVKIDQYMAGEALAGMDSAGEIRRLYTDPSLRLIVLGGKP